MEPAHTYYNCTAQITVILREHHSNCYRLGELARMSKDCFYAGLFAREPPYGGSPEGPAPYHPFGSTEGTDGAGERCLDTYTIPTIYICQINTPTEAGRALLPTAARWQKERWVHCPPCPIGCRPSGGGTRDRPSTAGWHNGRPRVMVQWWIPHWPLPSCWDQWTQEWPLLQLSEGGPPLVPM